MGLIRILKDIRASQWRCETLQERLESCEDAIRSLTRTLGSYEDDLAYLDQRLKSWVGRETGGKRRPKGSGNAPPEEEPAQEIDLNERIKRGLSLEGVCPQ